MKIAKAAAGLVGVGLALGAVSPAFAAPQPQLPAGAEAQLLDSVTRTTQETTRDPQGALGGVDVDEKSGELTADNPAAATSVADETALGAVSTLGGLPVGAPTG